MVSADSPVGARHVTHSGFGTFGETLRRGAVVVVMFLSIGCGDRTDRMQPVQQTTARAKNGGDDLRSAMRYLAQMTPLNREAISKEVQLYLNKWSYTLKLDKGSVETQKLVDGLPPDLRSETGLAATDAKLFNIHDIEYLYQCRNAKQISDWVTAAPLRDSLLKPGIETLSKKLGPEEGRQLEQACKLFDWTMRNVALKGDAADIEKLSDDPRKPLSDNGVGYGYLPWQATLFSRGDFIERGRVFATLAKQRGIRVCWIGLRPADSPTTKIWAVGVLVSDECYVFDPKLSLPILNPDTLVLASLKEIQKDPRILRRCDIPGKFDYAVNPTDVNKLEFFLDVEPSALATRVVELERVLLGDERMLIASDADAVSGILRRNFPEASISLWQTPVLAQIYAEYVRQRITQNSPFTAKYMTEHAIWFNDSPAARARIKHLRGEFQSTLEGDGALTAYVNCHIPEEQISRLVDDPDIQKELGIIRNRGEEMPAFQARMMLMQLLLGRSKLDANFLLGQLHFDLGDYGSAEFMLKNRTLGDNRAAPWFPAAWYTLARTYEEEGKIDKALEAYTQGPSQMEPGNRLRMRYLTREQSAAPSGN